MADDRRDGYERWARALDALGDGTTQEKLDQILGLWLSVAANARNEHLPHIDGYLAEQQRQIQQIDLIATAIRTAVPDLEGERLYRAGDMDAWAAHVLRQIQQAKASGTKGGA